MNSLLEVVKKIADNCEMQYSNNPETDYTDSETGLIYCGLCCTPKQAKVILLGDERIMNCICHCESERYKREEAQKKFYERIRKNKENGKIPAMFADAASDRIDDYKKRTYAQKYALKFDAVGNNGFLLYGDVGTGKSYFAACIANALLNKGMSVRWLTSMQIVEMSGFFNKSEYDSYLESIAYPDLLIIDDLSAERGTDYALERVHELVDYRISSCKPVIVTTNFELAYMKETSDLRRRRTFDRIFQCCLPLGFHGVSYRQKQAKANFDEIRKLLGITE